MMMVCGSVVKNAYKATSKACTQKYEGAGRIE